ncbi:MAG: UDP-glucose/GDP-mannose dehydrogenase family protein [Flexilinea sp.]
MRISIFGLGYVGCVCGACLAKFGNTVVGVDINQGKVDLINSGRPTIIEKGIDDLVHTESENGRFTATENADAAVKNSDVSIIAVGTPGMIEGHLDLSYVFRVAEQIGGSLCNKKTFHVIVIRSTVIPGTNRKVAELIESVSKKKNGKDFSIVSNPEFLREGSAIEDFLHPPLTLIGCEDGKAEQIMRELYQDIHAEFVVTDICVAEMMKYVNNTYHALKIVFANEIGNICKSLNIDSHKVMEIFCKDRQLNISPYYFKPGFAYGGSCLPKDLKALRTLAHDNYINVPVINSIEMSNEKQKRNAIDMIIRQGKNRIGILGLSFKAGTDDLRSSPIIDIVETLLGKGFDLRIYDKNVKLSELTGTNRNFIESKIPHLQRFLTNDLDAVLTESDVLVISNKEIEFNSIPKRFPGKILIDLVRICNPSEYDGTYEGIAWG